MKAPCRPQTIRNDIKERIGLNATTEISLAGGSLNPGRLHVTDPNAIARHSRVGMLRERLCP
jgi:hypothetical protein